MSCNELHACDVWLMFTINHVKVLQKKEMFMFSFQSNYAWHLRKFLERKEEERKKKE